MKKKNSKSLERDGEMLPEYDFRDGVRGKHYQAYRKGHTVTIHKNDGTSVVQHFKLEEGAVVLDPDVQAHFPNSLAVNKALRCLIPLLPKKTRSKERERV
jgi:hypothetical protein